MPLTIDPSRSPKVPNLCAAMRKNFGENCYENGIKFAEILAELPLEGQYVSMVKSLSDAVAFISVSDPAASIAAVAGWLRFHFPDILADLDSEDADALIAGVESAV